MNQSQKTYTLRRIKEIADTKISAIAKELSDFGEVENRYGKDSINSFDTFLRAPKVKEVIKLIKNKKNWTSIEEVVRHIVESLEDRHSSYCQALEYYTFRVTHLLKDKVIAEFLKEHEQKARKAYDTAMLRIERIKKEAMSLSDDVMLGGTVDIIKITEFEDREF